MKIVWTVRADPIAAEESLFSTETRVVSTDAAARARVRWWSFFSPGMILIRWLWLDGARPTQSAGHAASPSDRRPASVERA